MSLVRDVLSEGETLGGLTRNALHSPTIGSIVAEFNTQNHDGSLTFVI